MGHRYAHALGRSDDLLPIGLRTCVAPLGELSAGAKPLDPRVEVRQSRVGAAQHAWQGKRRRRDTCQPAAKRLAKPDEEHERHSLHVLWVHVLSLGELRVAISELGVPVLLHAQHRREGSARLDLCLGLGFLIRRLLAITDGMDHAAERVGEDARVRIGLQKCVLEQIEAKAKRLKRTVCCVWRCVACFSCWHLFELR